MSILVPAYNEARVIGRTVEALLQSRYSGYEIIAIDDGSTDGTADVVREYARDPRLRVLVREHEGKSRALNAGIREARGEIVVTTDADTILDPDFITRAVAEFADPGVAAVSGNVKVGNRQHLLASWQSIEYVTAYNLDRRAYALLNCIPVVPGAASAWRKRDLLLAGGFGHDTLAEDADLTVRLRRLGRRIGYAERALAWTESPSSVANFLKQRRRWSYGTLQVLWKHRAVLLRPRYGALGLVAFPSAVMYLGLVLLAPIMEAGVIWAVGDYAMALLRRNRDMPLVLESPLGPLLYCIPLVGIEWTLSVSAFIMDRERVRPLLWVPVQRLVLRWLLYYTMYRSLLAALSGLEMGWGKVERTGTASHRPAEARAPSNPAGRVANRALDGAA